MDGIIKADARQCPSPGFFVNVASKGVSISASPLESTLARTPTSVDFKGVKRIPRGFRDMTSGEGRAGVGTCGRPWTEYR